MKKITKEDLKSIVKSLQLETNDVVLDDILILWNSLEERLNFLQQIDTNNVKPMTHIDETLKIDFLRDDIVDTSELSLSKKEILSNAKDKNDDYIITTKVVK